MKYLSYLCQKTAAPADSLSQLEFYHGNHKQESVKPIFTSGLEGQEKQGKSSLAPVKGGVYLASDFRYAMIYALGGNMIGRSYTPSDIKEEPYGFIFTVPKENLKDVHPDEDSIGEYIYQIYAGTETNLGSNLNYLLKSIAERVSTPGQLEKLKDGQYMYFAAVGKKVLKQLSDNAKLQIIQSGAHMFNMGEIKVSGVYIFKRNQGHLLTGDLSKDKPHMVYLTNYSQFDKAIQELENI